MALQQVLNYVKNISETLNQWAANAKKAEELPVMETMDPEGLLIVSELVDGVWTSKQLEIQKIIEGISLSGQDNKVREVLLGTITADRDLNYLLDNTGITVTENEIIVVTALTTVNATLIQKQFLWKLGKGDYNPIGSANRNTKLIELQPKFLSEITSDELTSSPSAIVYDFGVITDAIIDVINTANPAYNYTDNEKIYYIRATKDGVKLLYNFTGINGMYGNGASQMIASDLVLVYSSANTDIADLLSDLENRIVDLEMPIEISDVTGLSSELADKVVKVAGKGLSTEDFSTSEKNKLASIDATHYLAPLQTTVQLSALPQAGITDKARVYVENDLADYFYDATASTGDIAPDDQTGGVGFWRKVAVGGETAASIKAKYESNPDTNAFTDAEQALVATVADKESSSNKTGTIAGNEASTDFFGTVKAWIDYLKLGFIALLPAKATALVDADVIAIGDSADSFKTKTRTFAQLKATLKTYFDSLYQAILVPGTNIKNINGESILGPGNITITGGGGGDMTTTTDQTVSGLKTFLHQKFGFRNVANTFTAFFTNTNTANRTYTWQNRDGTIADLTDIATKMANPTGGIANYLPKFGTATTLILSRLWDTGTFFGIGVVNSPTKDLTLGNQANREIGVEISDSSTVGRDLIVSAGKTVNYVLTANFLSVHNIASAWLGISVNETNSDVYVVSQGVAFVHKQTGGVGNFVSIEGLGGSINLRDVSVNSSNSDVWVVNNGSNGTNGGIWKQTGGVGAFAQIVANGGWFNVAVNSSNGDVYAIGTPLSGVANIYKLTGGTGSLINLSEPTRAYKGIAINKTNNDVYVAVSNGDIYKQTSGTGSFVGLAKPTRSWSYLSINSTTNDVLASDGNNIYKQTGGTGDFISIGQVNTWVAIAVDSANSNIYATTSNGIFKQTNFALGGLNLNGGKLIQKAGTGKGTGQSRYEIWTGQKTGSGTDMQVETLREYIDENGYHVYTSMPVFENNASAIAGGLPLGCEYRTSTGIKMIVY